MHKAIVNKEVRPLQCLIVKMETTWRQKFWLIDSFSI